MKKISIFKYLLILTLFIFASCAKKENQIPIPNPCKLLSYSGTYQDKPFYGASNNVSFEASLNYDSTERVKSFSVLYTNDNKSTIIYSGNTIERTDVDGRGKTISKRLYNINSDGNVIIQVYTYYENGVATTDQVTFTYEYDGGGYLSKTTTLLSWRNSTNVETYVYNDGNLTSSRSTGISGDDIYIYEYTDKVNTGKNDPFFKYGRINKNLVKKVTNKYATFVGLTPYPASVTDYTYILDSKNNITQKKETITYASSDVEVYTYDYVYECK